MQRNSGVLANKYIQKILDISGKKNGNLDFLSELFRNKKKASWKNVIISSIKITIGLSIAQEAASEVTERYLRALDYHVAIKTRTLFFRLKSVRL